MEVQKFDVFFNHPQDPLDLSLLFSDVRSAKYHLALVAAWLTDTELVTAFMQSTALGKIVILNKADTARGSRKAIKTISEYMDKRWSEEIRKGKVLRDRTQKILEDAGESIPNPVTNPELIDDFDIDRYVSLWIQAKNIACKELDIDNRVDTDGVSRVSIIGSDNWQSGVMHHKFIVADNVVWFGSFNFTFNARNNYETLARVESEEIAKTFWEEAKRMAIDESIWETPSGAVGGTIFRCDICLRIFPMAQHNWHGSHGTTVCNSCLKLAS